MGFGDKDIEEVARNGQGLGELKRTMAIKTFQMKAFVMSFSDN